MKWLNKKPAGEKFKDYSDVSNVEKDKEVLELSGAYEVLKGLHNRGLHLPPDPSRKDIAFLKKCYGMLLYCKSLPLIINHCTVCNIIASQALC